MKLFYLKGRQLMYAVINSPLPFYINMKLLKKWTLEIKKTHFWILVQKNSPLARFSLTQKTLLKEECLDLRWFFGKSI